MAKKGFPRGDDEDMVVTSVDHILDTLDASAFVNHCWAVATAADGCEVSWPSVARGLKPPRYVRASIDARAADKVVPVPVTVPGSANDVARM